MFIEQLSYFFGLFIINIINLDTVNHIVFFKFCRAYYLLSCKLLLVNIRDIINSLSFPNFIVFYSALFAKAPKRD